MAFNRPVVVLVTLTRVTVVSSLALLGWWRLRKGPLVERLARNAQALQAPASERLKLVVSPEGTARLEPLEAAFADQALVMGAAAP